MSDREVVLSTRAYAKMLLHATRYPHAAVSGLLLEDEKASARGASALHIVDAVPLFHQCLHVSPMYEIALTQVEARARSAGRSIAGMYGACENRAHNTADKLADLRVADKIADLVPHALLAVIDNRALTRTLSRTPLATYHRTDSGWRLKPADTLRLEESDAGSTVGELVARGVERELVDFDNHLDSLALDYTNPHVDALLRPLA